MIMRMRFCSYLLLLFFLIYLLIGINYMVKNIIINQVFDGENYRTEIHRDQNVISSNGEWIIQKITNSSITIQSLKFPYERYSISLPIIKTSENWLENTYYSFVWSPNGKNLVLSVIKGRYNPQGEFVLLRFVDGKWTTSKIDDSQVKANRQNYFPFWSIDGESLKVYSEIINDKNSITEITIDSYSVKGELSTSINFQLSDDDFKYFSNSFSIIPFAYNNGVILHFSNYEKTRLLIFDKDNNNYITKFDLQESGKILAFNEGYLFFYVNNSDEKEHNFQVINLEKSIIKNINFESSNISMDWDKPVFSSDGNFVGFIIDKTNSPDADLSNSVYKYLSVWDWKNNELFELSKSQDVIGWNQEFNRFITLKRTLGFLWLLEIAP